MIFKRWIRNWQHQILKMKFSVVVKEQTMKIETKVILLSRLKKLKRSRLLKMKDLKEMNV